MTRGRRDRPQRFSALKHWGQIALTAESDRFNTRRWAFDGGAVPLGPQDLRVLQVSDFEVVDFGPVRQAFPLDHPTNEWPDCVRVS